ncbi:MAG: DUF4112 domain-containing protein [Cytophagales bacterium]|jgi:hypothetical protein|nr:DUF4112 domain-containing protein [Cytophagales bacterium]
MQTEEKDKLRWIEQSSRLLDSAFRVPGTNFRIGLDPILGLIPVAGDLVSMGMSAMIIWTVIRHGASGRLILKMTANVLLDTLVGSIPLLGNVFDFVYQANQRNVRLLREYHYEGKHRGSAWGVWLAIVLLVLAWLAAMIWLVWWLFQRLAFSV